VSDRLAALDLGSNSFHLLVADTLHGGRIKRVANRKTTLRLAEPVARDGELGREARERAEDAVADLLEVARDKGARQVAAVATSAIRDAGDGDKLREALRDRHGVDVKVVDGLTEGYLSLRGMAGALNLPRGDALLGLDLGGGSYEVVYGGQGPLVAGATLALGSARLRERFRYDPPRFAERAALHAEALSALAGFAAELAATRDGEAGPPRAAATAGTIRDLARLGLALTAGTAPERVRGVLVARDQLERAYAWLCSVPTAERMELPGVSNSRADLLPAGGAVLLATMEALGLEHLELCDWGLREGILLDALTDEQVVSTLDFTPLGHDA
jgi:exopolyphosphatase/guanosine-5'-triphosphate,3'-diphosphate pyrophosphatase